MFRAFLQILKKIFSVSGFVMFLSPLSFFNTLVFPPVSIIYKLHLNPPGSDETGVGFNQVVRDVPVRQVQHRVP